MGFECKYCGKYISSQSGLTGHEVSCKQNPNREKWLKKVIEGSKIAGAKKIIPREDYNISCLSCKKMFVVRLKKWEYEKKEYKKFCSHRCSAIYYNFGGYKGEYECPWCGKVINLNGMGSHIWRIHTEEGRTFVRKQIIWNKGLTKETDIRIKRIAEKVSKTVKGRPRSPRSIEYTKERRRKMGKHQKYKEDARFQFNVYNYPEAFNLEKAKKYGWYKAKNRGDNPNGITRDHLISVQYGFENDIPPELIAHPANCWLMRQLANVSKNKKCEITLYELLKRIESWNKKYGGPIKLLEKLSIQIVPITQPGRVAD